MQKAKFKDIPIGAYFTDDDQRYPWTWFKINNDDKDNSEIFKCEGRDLQGNIDSCDLNYEFRIISLSELEEGI